MDRVHDYALLPWYAVAHPEAFEYPGPWYVEVQPAPDPPEFGMWVVDLSDLPPTMKAHARQLRAMQSIVDVVIRVAPEQAPWFRQRDGWCPWRPREEWS